jgi:hypothetical protein
MSWDYLLAWGAVAFCVALAVVDPAARWQRWRRRRRARVCTSEVRS